MSSAIPECPELLAHLNRKPEERVLVARRVPGKKGNKGNKGNKAGAPKGQYNRRDMRARD